MKILVQTTIGSNEKVLLHAIEMKNGGNYIGEWKNGMRHGFGEFKWADYSFYKGLHNKFLSSFNLTKTGK